MCNAEKDKCVCVAAPFDGRVVPLEQVPDPVFSEKVLGDGCAIIPDGGKIYSPVNGEISSVADTKHAYGFTSEDGLEILVHFGLETVALKGEGFTSYVKEGDKVKIGDLIAEVDLELLKKNNINMITPIIVCDGADDHIMNVKEGTIKAGCSVVSFYKELSEEVAVGVESNTNANNSTRNESVSDDVTSDDKPKRKFKINFDFLQKLGMVLMTVIAV